MNEVFWHPVVTAMKTPAEGYGIAVGRLKQQDRAGVMNGSARNTGAARLLHSLLARQRAR